MEDIHSTVSEAAGDESTQNGRNAPTPAQFGNGHARADFDSPGAQLFLERFLRLARARAGEYINSARCSSKLTRGLRATRCGYDSTARRKA